MILIKKPEIFGRDEGDLFFVGSCSVEFPVFGHKVVESLPFFDAVVVFALGEVAVFDQGLAIEKAIDSFQVREDVIGCVGCPISAVRDDEHGAGGDDGCDFHGIGDVVGSRMNGHAAFTITSSVEVRGDHGARHGHRDALVDGGELHGHRSASRCSCDQDAGVIASFERSQKIKATNAIPELELEDLVIKKMLPAHEL